MTKNELQIKIAERQQEIKQYSDLINNYTDTIVQLQKQLKDINKPKLTPLQFDELTELVEQGVGEFDFDDLDNYSIDYGIDYDNRVTCESFCFDNASELARVICETLYKMFAEANEDDNQLNQD